MAKATIVFAEDSPATRMTIGDVLRDDGYKIVESKTGEETRAVLREIVPDLILLDIIMPHDSGQPENDEEGAEILKWIRKQPKFAHVPIVVFSVRGYDGDRDEFLRDGAAAVIDKPAAPREVLNAVRKQLGGKGQEQGN